MISKELKEAMVSLRLSGVLLTLDERIEYAMDKNSFVQLVLVSQNTKATLKDMELLERIAKLESRNKELEQQVLALKSRIKKAIGALQ